MTYTKNDAKRNRITRRVRHIVALYDKHGALPLGLLRNYLSDCMESDIRRERAHVKELMGIINNKPCAYQEKRKEK